MNADGTLTDAEIAEKFGRADTGQRFRDIDGLAPGTEVNVGDYIRVVAYASPSYFDSLWDSAQENAEEHAGEVQQIFLDHGIVVAEPRVQGIEISDRNGDAREAYVYDFQVYGFTDPPEDKFETAGLPSPATVLSVLRGLVLPALALTGLVFSVTIAKVVIAGPGPGGEMIADAVEQTTGAAKWLAAAAIVGALVYLAVKYKPQGSS